jgi:hypothetical protein
VVLFFVEDIVNSYHFRSQIQDADQICPNENMKPTLSRLLPAGRRNHDG